MSAVRPLLGRERELGVIDDILAGCPATGRCLVLRGEAGIGKSALAAEAGRRAAAMGLRVLRASGVQSEAHLPFAGLHQLLQPIRGMIDDLPARQRAALRAALGTATATDGTAGADERPPDADDFFLVALATLTVLTEYAASAPVVALVEDAHWVDSSTRHVLAFVARRLESEPMVVLISTRDDPDEIFTRAALPELVLSGLTDQAASELLDRDAGDLTAQQRELVLREAMGNPLALVELPTTIADLAGAPLPPSWLPLTTRLESAFADRALRLPATTRAMLLVVAVADGDGLAEHLAAASVVVGAPVTEGQLRPAVATNLVTVGAGRVQFRHPLARSAILQSASESGRRAAHAALAQVLADEPDRRLWHRAAAVVGRDEQVAADLEAAAQRARQFREIAVAVAAFERAAALSDGSTSRGRRLLFAAETAFEMGRRDVVERVVAEAEQLDLGPLQRARLAWLRMLFEREIWQSTTNLAPFVAVVDQMRVDGDVDLASRCLFTVAQVAWWAEPGGGAQDLVLAAVDRMPLPADDPRLLATVAMAAPVDRAAAVIDRTTRLALDQTSDPEAQRLVGLALSTVGALDQAAGYFSDAVAGQRTLGRLGLLAQTLVSLAWCAFARGDWDRARSSADEAARLARETGYPGAETSARLVAAMLAAYDGEATFAFSVASEVERWATSRGARPQLAHVQCVRGVAALAEGRHSDAVDQLMRIFDVADPSHHGSLSHLAVVDLAEAAAGCHRTREVADVFDRLELVARRTPNPLLHASLRYARPMLADEAAAEAGFQAALNEGLQHWPFVRARLLFGYGTWLRRQRRIVESRMPLRAARDGFDALGAGSWRNRASRELRASGEASHRPGPSQRGRLTSQELQVAQMAAAGLTNRQIGEQLFLSHRTVGAHLRRIFPKLAVTSRSQLRDALESLRR
ncbi:LuxR family transcriptional regulator [Pseudofrankia sp. BMG5.36]|uniref:ATP-binding protein n=1 Tax=Pseudofrankia sp. BMG5.36 TaxID=1834512 RepID=UPI0018E2AA7E|nr:LuxR family transcriptional regulator [Pseudofrankia sp. BMG5.36]